MQKQKIKIKFHQQQSGGEHRACMCMPYQMPIPIPELEGKKQKIMGGEGEYSHNSIRGLMANTLLHCSHDWKMPENWTELWPMFVYSQCLCQLPSINYDLCEKMF
jgi:hypothetical protein